MNSMRFFSLLILCLLMIDQISADNTTSASNSSNTTSETSAGSNTSTSSSVSSSSTLQCIDPTNSTTQINNWLTNDTALMVNGQPLQVAYCSDVINWPISNDTLYNWQNLDQTAFDMYTKLYTKWLARAGENDNPTNDCLGVARIIFCTYEYKYCNSDQQTDTNTICQFLCDIWLDRCPAETDTYSLICSGAKSSKCAFGDIIKFWHELLWFLIGLIYALA